MKVYLAGGIQGVPNPFGWRNDVTKYFEKHGIETIDPLSGKTEEQFDSYNEREIITRDKRDIRNSHIVLAEVTDTHRPYIGTAMEILYSWEHEIPVVVWGTYKSYWLTYHSVAQFESLDECLDYIISFYGSDVS